VLRFWVVRPQTDRRAIFRDSPFKIAFGLKGMAKTIATHASECSSCYCLSTLDGGIKRGKSMRHNSAFIVKHWAYHRRIRYVRFPDLLSGADSDLCVRLSASPERARGCR
jgi:hypothetical protein